MEVHRMSPENVSGVREAVPETARTPRILCWNCKKLTPFHEERCEFCGARFAGATGGVYRTARPSVPAVPSDDEELAAARRSLLQLFEDLQRVHDVSSAHRYDPVREEETITLFQCPSCGRFVSEDADTCTCGVRFAPAAQVSVCPECGASVPGDGALCPACRAASEETPTEVAYACPLCGAEVSAEAVRCSCGARFEG
jgi:RNA polymerase subunit RPABC4/transcription elongation factor Spt4